METTNEEPQAGPLVQFLDPVWILQARDGTKVLFDPDPMGTDAWSELLVLKAEVGKMDEDDTTAGPAILARLHTILGSFTVDQVSRDAWDRSLPDLGLTKCLGLMKVYSEQITEIPT